MGGAKCTARRRTRTFLLLIGLFLPIYPFWPRNEVDIPYSTVYAISIDMTANLNSYIRAAVTEPGLNHNVIFVIDFLFLVGINKCMNIIFHAKYAWN